MHSAFLKSCEVANAEELQSSNVKNAAGQRIEGYTMDPQLPHLVQCFLKDIKRLSERKQYGKSKPFKFMMIYM